MRLLMTTDTVGGVWTFTSDLASELLAQGHGVALVSFGRAPSSEHSAWLRDLTVRFPHFLFAASEAPLEWMQENASAYSGGEALLLNLCRSFRPDALLLSQFCFGALPVDLPKIVVAHSDVLSWAAAVGKAPLADDAWLRTYCSLVQDGLRDADAVVAPTHAMLQDLRANFTLPPCATVIANGRTLATAASMPERRLQAVTAGRMWDEAKNLSLLLRCVSPMPILVAGECDEQRDGSVRTLGARSQAEILTLFRESAIYLCSSVYEPFGLAPLEAALCGCAVLANDIASLREVWGDAALYFHDAASLSRLLRHLCDTPGDLAEAQVRSHARARNYSSTRMTNEYFHLIETMMSETGRREAHAA